MFKCPQCGREMELVGARPNDEFPPTYFIYRCAEHGIFHFSKGSDFIAGLPPKD